MSDQAVQRTVKVERLSNISGDIYQVILVPADGQPMFWNAGQYLEVVMPTGYPCAYSIASAATDGLSLELHIQCFPGHERAREVVDYLQASETVNINIPKGDCFIDSCSDNPLVFIAAGTGFAQMKAMIEYSFMNGCPHPVHLYWGSRNPTGFYMPSLPIYWASEKGIHYHPVVSDRDAETDWEGRHGLLYQAVLEDIAELMSAHFYISGSPEMVYATLDALVEAGIPEAHVHSDVFAYCPRK
ncbi:hypothetical protein [Parendozoicomonas haliclonae]|uniref:NAD(P)H-flavin reductase n=1 Tax=Parendozoicomonas haliclonae TaxID=1960125 RepID=A0A1X7ANP4_9GAMM|nr:hypothetical protein [Parendozoicomonas haliclonae]SMA48608.1 NAD(P)H-flavin reductase [Parendozoicomonas haliclonae]